MQLSELFEAKVGTANVGAAMSRIVSYLEKKMGFKLRKLGVEHFKNSSGEGHGIRYVEDGTVNCLRFNWVGSKSSEIVSVDMWNGSSRDPQFSVTFKGTSLVKSLPTLVDVLKRPKIGKVKVHAEEREAALAEARQKCGSHPKFPECTYDEELSDKNTACFTDDDGEQRYVKRKDLPADHPNKAEKLDEAKKGEFTPEAAIKDMVSKLEAGRTFNRSEFVMNYHPENAHAYDDWVEEHKDELVMQGKRISLPKGAKIGAPVPKAGGSISGGGGSGELIVSKGGKGEEYEVEIPEDRVSFSESIEHLEGLTTGLIKGSFNALFVAGRGGTGKTQTVEDTLEEHGLTDGSGFFKITGSASPIGMYTALYKNRTGIILFDDCDGALESQDGRNIIKAATDTKKVRKIAWSKKSSGMYDPDDGPKKGKGSARADDEEDPEDGGDEDVDISGDQIPKHFEFTGRIIFISNLPLNKLDPDGALRTRAFIISIDPTAEEIFERMGEIVNDIKIEGGSLSAKERQNVLAVVKTSKNAKSASLRTLVRALGLAASGAPNWEKLVQLYA